MRIVQRLLGIADLQGLEVDFEVRVTSEQVLSALLEVIPDAEWWAEEGRDGSSERGDDPAACLPLRLRGWAMPPQAVEPFFKAVRDNPASARWDFNGWPEAPEVGLGVGGTRGAFVTLCVNVRDLELEEPAADHTVFVHVKQIEAERAPWLAAQVGLTVIGELVMAP
ncbi:hypothetical protein [Streptomyces sp. Act143]|uniref:hypothetical protein n=1 Tax=Streptomyces sp. Act143 TaxID=2200760 RepID=UPI00215AB536|nr:hypothetical protein [Streptomyces sp. Act143]